ncbi:hypothetical protein [Priestia aryabhattai]|uniref:hypothetical protein n=1 Tax=Priestia aryabhattai TaxID=412384 RepID=UPI003C9A1417
METACPVVKEFRDKHTKVIYQVGSEYVSSDEERVAILKGKGFITDEVKETEEPSEEDPKAEKDESILDGTAAEVIDAVTSETAKDEVAALLKVEKAEKNRKTVVKHLEALLNSEE